MLVRKVWNVIIGVSPVAFGCIVGDAQVVKSWQEHQDANDQDRNRPVCPAFAARRREPMIIRKVPIKNRTVARAMALYGILGGLLLNFNKLDLMTSGKKEDSHNLLALAVSFSL